MPRPIIAAAALALALAASTYAANPETGRSELPSATTGTMQYEPGTQSEDERLREAPGAVTPGTPARPGGVAPGQEQGRFGEPGQAPGAEGVPQEGRGWGLIVFVIAVIGIALLAFRRRSPPPPNP